MSVSSVDFLNKDGKGMMLSIFADIHLCIIGEERHTTSLIIIMTVGYYIQSMRL